MALESVSTDEPVFIGRIPMIDLQSETCTTDSPVEPSTVAGARTKPSKVVGRRRAKVAEQRAVQHEKPGFALRRVVELAREAREIQVRITGEAPASWRGHIPDSPATGEWLVQLQAAAEENRQKTAHYRRVLDDAGYMPSSQSVLRKGDRVLTDKGGAIVQKPGSQDVKLRFDHSVRWTSGPQYVSRAAYSRVWVLKATVERDQAHEPSPSTETPEASPRTPRRSPGPLTRLVAKHGEASKRYSVHQIIDALVEAERLGVGEKLARYFRATLKGQDVQRAYDRARGIVAFERDGRPASPLREQTYGVRDLGGIQEGLDHDPTVAQLLAALRAFPERRQTTTGPRPSGWFRTLVRETTKLLDNHQNEYERKAPQGQAAMPDFARMATEALVEKAARKLHELRQVQEPSLYDPKSGSEGIDSETARKILVDVFKVDFRPKHEGDEASEFCNGESTLETLAEEAAQRAKEERARKEHERAQRQLDARELLEVHREAASRGEVTKAGFNAAYWRLHPGFETPTRGRRALMMAERDGKVVAVVRGPMDSAFGVRLPGGTDEQAAVAALIRQIEQEAGEVGTAEAPRLRKPKKAEPIAKVEPASKAEPPSQAEPASKAESTSHTKPTSQAERTTNIDVEVLAKKHDVGTDAPTSDEVEPVLVAAECQGVGQAMDTRPPSRGAAHANPRLRPDPHEQRAPPAGGRAPPGPKSRPAPNLRARRSPGARPPPRAPIAAKPRSRPPRPPPPAGDAVDAREKPTDALPMLTVKEAAVVLRSTPDAIYRRIRRGTLPAVRDGKRVLVPRRAVEAVTGPIGRQPQPDAGPSSGLRGLSTEPVMETNTTECTTDKNFFSILPCTNGKARWSVNFYVHEPERKRPRNVRRLSPHESKAETRRWATQLLAGFAVDKAPEPEPTSPTAITVRVACERWLATQDTDLCNKQRHIDWILLAWGEETTMASLTHEQIVGLGAKLRQPLGPRASERSRARRPEREGRPRRRKGEGLGPATVRSICKDANRILAFAAGMGWRSAASVPLAKLPITEAEWLTVDELVALLEHAGKWRLAIMLGARAGLRRGEIVELRWRDVDLDNRRIRVSRAFRKTDAGDWVVSTCKGKEARTVTIPDDLVAALREAQGKRGDLVVTLDGERIPPPTFSDTVPEILQAAGLYRPGLGVHALRHTYCSHLAQGGAPPKAIQMLAGHKSERTTARYTHLSPLHVADAVRCLPDLTKI
ncbi:tyrosine-type recombinase/integrase [Paraliomyxa miuraensis]|uniref:tyrosine-type recombinase/integrase n=1 Tax=Paraliomyxa miuraensis TaxID=376150 RepID=UPI00225B69D5|nr:tyrosine-type recombinase/integrase [Paraliomyxa miuraensis]MCX4240163.1 tyrosine-type recombinase/integrase [Paraliomyxa miuraensis]